MRHCFRERRPRHNRYLLRNTPHKDDGPSSGGREKGGRGGESDLVRPLDFLDRLRVHNESQGEGWTTLPLSLPGGGGGAGRHLRGEEAAGMPHEKYSKFLVEERLSKNGIRGSRKKGLEESHRQKRHAHGHKKDYQPNIPSEKEMSTWSLPDIRMYQDKKMFFRWIGLLSKMTTLWIKMTTLQDDTSTLNSSSVSITSFVNMLDYLHGLWN